VETNGFGMNFLQLLLWLNVYEVFGILKVIKMSLDDLYQYLRNSKLYLIPVENSNDLLILFDHSWWCL